MISSSNLILLAEPPVLKKLMQSLAALDAIISQDWEYRYFLFNSHWDENEMMGSMRNGQGDEMFVLFNPYGAFIKGFDHELWDHDETASENFYREVPSCFLGASTEPAFSTHLVTFCCWRTLVSEHWTAAERPSHLSAADGSEWMLSMLDGDPASYVSFAEDYYEFLPDERLVTRIHMGLPVSRELASSLNAEIDYERLIVDLREIGYPFEAE